MILFFVPGGLGIAEIPYLFALLHPTKNYQIQKRLAASHSLEAGSAFRIEAVSQENYFLSDKTVSVSQSFKDSNLLLLILDFYVGFGYSV